MKLITKIQIQKCLKRNDITMKQEKILILNDAKNLDKKEAKRCENL
jgi:hypothetical protein